MFMCWCGGIVERSNGAKIHFQGLFNIKEDVSLEYRF